MSCRVGNRCGLDLVLLWLWCRLAAVAPNRPLAWESPYAMGVALKMPKKKKKKKFFSMMVYHSIVNLVPCFCKDLSLLFFLIYAIWLQDRNLDGSNFIYSFIFCFLGPHPRHMEVPRLGVQSKVSAGLHHSHSNARSKPYLRPTPQLTPDP